MSQGLRMVHLRTVPDAWHARVLAARLGCEGIVTHLQGNLSGPYPFGTVSVLVEAEQAELAAALLLADEVEASFPGHDSRPLGERSAAGRTAAGGLAGDVPLEFCENYQADLPDDGHDGFFDALADTTEDGTYGYDDAGPRRPKVWSPWQRALAVTAAVLVAGAPLLAHFFGQ
jgi:hypothetical protein